MICKPVKSKRSTNSLWKIMEQHPPMLIDKQYNLYGWSQAAFRTSFLLRELECMFDLGLSYSSIRFGFLTHGHSDHSGSLKFHNDHVRITLYAPEQLAIHVENYIRSGKSLSKCRDYALTNEDPLIIGVHPGFTQELIIKKKRFSLKVYECYHSVPCVGYGLSEWKSETLPEYKGLSSDKFIALKNEGVVTKYDVLKHTFLYLGDTTHEVFNDQLVDGEFKPNEIFKYTTIMVECTFLKEDEIENAIETKHMHWVNLNPVILAHPECFFILFHFSKRYTTDEINDFFADRMLPNMTTWVSE